MPPRRSHGCLWSLWRSARRSIGPRSGRLGGVARDPPEHAALSRAWARSQGPLSSTVTAVSRPAQGAPRSVDARPQDRSVDHRPIPLTRETNHRLLRQGRWARADRAPARCLWGRKSVGKDAQMNMGGHGGASQQPRWWSCRRSGVWWRRTSQERERDERSQAAVSAFAEAWQDRTPPEGAGPLRRHLVGRGGRGLRDRDLGPGSGPVRVDVVRSAALEPPRTRSSG